MLNRKIMLITILIILPLAISAVSAESNITDGTAQISIDDTDDLNIESTSTKSFSDLNDFIVNSTETNIYLTEDYAFSEDSDSNFINGIVISKSIQIFGNGHTIDAKSKARIFNVTSNVGFNGINFINGNSECGSAIWGFSFHVNSCNFSNNYAVDDGGALYNGYAENCIFFSNSAYYGGAMYGGSVNNCTFMENNANYGGAIYNVVAVNSSFIENFVYHSGGAMYGGSASGCNFTQNSAIYHSGAATNCYVVSCIFRNNTAGTNGGAMYGEGSSANNCTFDSNSANEGGAVYGFYVEKCIFINNHASEGGAIAAGSAKNCIFNYNYADTGGALSWTYVEDSNFTANHANLGGALYHESSDGCRFISNYANQGGAIFEAYGKKSYFEGNSANFGGAICNGGAESSIFYKNHARNGGAMYGGSQEGSAQGCRFISNIADDYGGALYATSVWNSYFEGNTANYGGALAGGSSASGSSFVNNVARISGGVKHNSYVGVSNSGTSIVIKGNSPEYKLYISDLTFIEGFGGNINVKLSDSPNNYVIGENLTAKVYNSKNVLVGTYKPQTGYNWFTNFAPGTYRVVISVDDLSYEAKSVTIKIMVKKATSIYVTGVTANYNSGKCLLVNLHDSAGNILKYYKVSINLNGTTKTYYTDGNGQVILATNGLIPKTYTATISYAGSNTYMGTSASAKIVIKKLSPKLSALGKTFKRSDKTKKYTITLKNNKNVVMKNTKVTVKVNGKIYSAKTNNKGVATFKLKKLTKKGKYKTVVTYGGNAYYNSVSKTVKIIVK